MARRRFRVASDALLAPLEILRPIPAVAWISLAILMFATPEGRMVYIAFIGAFFPILLNTIHGVRSLDRRLLFASMTLGAGPVAMFREVILPGALPSIVTGLSIGMGTSWFSLVTAEMISDQFGIGYYTWKAYTLQNYPDIVVGMISIGVLGIEQLAVQTGGRVVHAVVASGRGNRMSTLPSLNGARGAIRLRNVSVSFGAGADAVEAVRNVNLEILPGEFVAILGPSGCGKSTRLGAVAGFTRHSAGEIIMDGQAVRQPSAERGVVFQHHTLFPWKTVLENAEFGLKMRGLRKAERRARARDILQRVGLGEFERCYPEQLSGGMQQRVNLARVLVNRPHVLLMDEPFSALDAQTRLQMQELLLELWHELRTTVIFVTHDIDEAIFLSDRLVVLSKRPGQLSAEIACQLERPRTADLLVSPGFMSLKRECMGWLRERRVAVPLRGDTRGGTPDADAKGPDNGTCAAGYPFSPDYTR